MLYENVKTKDMDDVLKACKEKWYWGNKCMVDK